MSDFYQRVKIPEWRTLRTLLFSLIAGAGLTYSGGDDHDAYAWLGLLIFFGFGIAAVLSSVANQQYVEKQARQRKWEEPENGTVDILASLAVSVGEFWFG